MIPDITDACADPTDDSQVSKGLNKPTREGTARTAAARNLRAIRRGPERPPKHLRPDHQAGGGPNLLSGTGGEVGEGASYSKEAVGGPLAVDCPHSIALRGHEFQGFGGLH